MIEKRKKFFIGRIANVEKTAPVSKRKNNINFSQRINSVFAQNYAPGIFPLVAIDWFTQRGGRPHD